MEDCIEHHATYVGIALGGTHPKGYAWQGGGSYKFLCEVDMQRSSHVHGHYLWSRVYGYSRSSACIMYQHFC